MVLRHARDERFLLPSLPASGKLRLSIGTVDNLAYRSKSCQIGFDTGGSDRRFWGCLMTKLNFAVSTAVLATMLAAAPAYAQDTAGPAATEAGDDGIIEIGRASWRERVCQSV